MILIAKPHKAGSVSTGKTDLSDLLESGTPAAELIPAVDYGQWGNPDGVMGADKVAMHPDFRGGHPQGALRAENMSGEGMIHQANQTTAPMSAPFAAGPDTVRANPRTIAV